MNRIEDFRIFYNHTIHPELQRLERSRMRLLRLLLLSSILLTIIIIVEIYLNILLITLFLMIPIGLYITYLLYRVRKFIMTFKPNVVNLILDFIDDCLNYGTLSYDSKRFISKDRFKASKLFSTKAPFYEGEDFISGKIGELDFELCELWVREDSPAQNRLNDVFKGIFLHAIFNLELEGELVVWPRSQRQYLIRSIKTFTFNGGENVDHEILHEPFREHFMTYAMEDTYVVGLLPYTVQEAIMKYQQEYGKEIFLAIIRKDIYIGISEPKDMLEPYLFQSNLSFDLIREFFEDIQIALSIVEDFDQSH